MKNLQTSLMISLLLFGQALSAQDKNSYLEVIKKNSKDFAAMQAGALYGAGRGVQGAANETLEQIPGYIVDGMDYGSKFFVPLGAVITGFPLLIPCVGAAIFFGALGDDHNLSRQQRVHNFKDIVVGGAMAGALPGVHVMFYAGKTVSAVTGACLGTLHGVSVGGLNGLQQGAQEGYDAVQNIEKLTSGDEVVETAAWFGAASAVPAAVVGAIYLYRQPIKDIVQGLLKKS